MRLQQLSRRCAISFAAAALSVGLIAAPNASTAQEERDYLLATASTGGTYYPVGVALATLIKVRLQPGEGINLSAINSAGSGENVKLLREDEAQFAILQGLYGYFAWNGVGPVEPDGPQENLRAVTMLWPNVEHFVLHNDYVDTGTIADIMGAQGEAASMGRRNSGTIGSNSVLLDHLGIDDLEAAFDLVYLGYNPSADALQNGQIVAMSTPAGDPVAAVTRAFAAMGDDITLLQFDAEQAAQADGGFGLWTPYTVPAGTYPGVDEDTQTVAQPNFLAVRADLDEEAVYLITKTIYENLGFLQGIHPVTNAMSLDSALAGLPMPLHPGALRYYEEVGLDVPDNLRAAAD